MEYATNQRNEAVIRSNEDIRLLLRRLSRTPLTARFIPAPEDDERVIVLDKGFSDLAGILSSRYDFPRIDENKLFELSFGELMVMIEDYLTSSPAGADMQLRGYNDAIVLMRSLADILLRLEPLEDDAALMPDELLPYCTVDGWTTALYNAGTPVAGALYETHFKEVYRLLSEQAGELPRTYRLTINEVLWMALDKLSGGTTYRNEGVLLMLHLLIWPIALYEKNNRGVTAAQIRARLKKDGTY